MEDTAGVDESISDTELVRLFRAGDADSAHLLYQRHFEMAVRLARRTAPHPSEAEEIASESFARVLEAIRRGGGPADSFSLYLRSTVRNTSFSALRHRARMHTIDNIERIVVDHVPDHADFGRDLDSDLAAAFAGLSERYQRVLWARVLEGKSNRESAADLGIAATAEAMLYHRARRALKKSYLETEDGRLRTAIAAFRARRRVRH
ncbi:sigma-70 family RNA polymerase sigma factor [Microbacterium maritypicum]|uniref:Sigma-70 family RNA polymerase sigma factor n=1 Tax=Microbacterium maritypicum TaxID=33918 RepID=A0AAD3ZYC9_MICMQ|nr:sigma-70 family RNA polymerase sigma factor [Microbacterium liquefaciens]KAB1885889.1 sigma-70 family RNA polymerase sigma factor [Microbacterium liquefaciens]